MTGGKDVGQGVLVVKGHENVAGLGTVGIEGGSRMILGRAGPLEALFLDAGVFDAAVGRYFVGCNAGESFDRPEIIFGHLGLQLGKTFSACCATIFLVESRTMRYRHDIDFIDIDYWLFSISVLALGLFVNFYE